MAVPIARAFGIVLSGSTISLAMLLVGILGFADAGRVYVDGESPGGWHTAMGGGFWVGAVNAATNVNVLFTNNENRKVMVSLGFHY